MKKETIKFFNLKRTKHPRLGMGYEYLFQKRDWVKNPTALLYALYELELWAKNMQEVVKKEEKL
jgi:hypothetical protein